MRICQTAVSRIRISYFSLHSLWHCHDVAFVRSNAEVNVNVHHFCIAPLRFASVAYLARSFRCFCSTAIYDSILLSGRNEFMKIG